MADDPAVEKARLLARLSRQFDVVHDLIRIGDCTVSFTRVADPDRVLDQVAAAEDRRERELGRRTPSDELHLPYWAELWDSAVGMAHWIAAAGLGRATAEDRPISVMDLGCGMGLSGTAALTLGASVTFADLEPAALLFARLNSLPWKTKVRIRQLDWRTDDLNDRFDHILGADILYERAQWDYLEPFWRRHLKPTGKIHLGEPGRQTGELFVTWIAERGWRLEESAQPVATRPRPIRIFTLTAVTSVSPGSER